MRGLLLAFLTSGFGAIARRGRASLRSTTKTLAKTTVTTV